MPNRTLAAILSLALAGCKTAPTTPMTAPDAEESKPAVSDPTQRDRDHMVDSQLVRRGITDPEVLAAMRVVPRHAYVPPAARAKAYADYPLPIGSRQTISQPYIVALMTELADVDPGERVLDVGTGSGYQAAVLAEIGVAVYTIEIVPELGERAARDLEATGYSQIHTRIGDGYAGWPEAAPFDAIILAAAPDHVPEPLKEQLAIGGKLILPVGGSSFQELTVITRTESGFDQRGDIPVLFVPMTGEALDP